MELKKMVCNGLKATTKSINDTNPILKPRDIMVKGKKTATIKTFSGNGVFQEHFRVYKELESEGMFRKKPEYVFYCTVNVI
jgi:hypothetical protein